MSLCFGEFAHALKCSLKCTITDEELAIKLFTVITGVPPTTGESKNSKPQNAPKEALSDTNGTAEKDKKTSSKIFVTPETALAVLKKKQLFPQFIQDVLEDKPLKTSHTKMAPPIKADHDTTPKICKNDVKQAFIKALFDWVGPVDSNGVLSHEQKMLWDNLLYLVRDDPVLEPKYKDGLLRRFYSDARFEDTIFETFWVSLKQNNLEMDQYATSRHNTALKNAWKTIIGYSIVGVGCSLLGFCLQIYNYKKNVALGTFLNRAKTFFLAERSSFFPMACVFIIMILGIILFSATYSALYLHDPEKDSDAKQAYRQITPWIKTTFIAFVVSFSTSAFITKSTIAQRALLPMGLVCAIFILSSMWYKNKLPWLSIKNISSHSVPARDENRFTLVYPGILIVALTTYVSSCTFELVSFNWPFYVPIAAIALFLFLLTIVHNSALNVAICYCLYSFFVIFLIYIVHNTNQSAFIVASASLCLAVALSIYLSVFESWFVLSTRSEDQEWEKSRSVKITDEAIICLMPLFVFVCYPFQHFGSIYLVGFVVGHSLAAYYWCNKVCLQRNYWQVDDLHGLNKLFRLNENRWKYARAIFGLCTIAILTADKVWSSLNFSSIFNYTPTVSTCLLSFLSLSPVVSLGLAISCAAICVSFLWGTRQTLSCIRFLLSELALFFTAWGVLAVMYSGDFAIDQSRILYAMAGLLVYTLISLIVGVLRILVLYDKEPDIIRTSFQNMGLRAVIKLLAPKFEKFFEKGAGK